MNMIKQCAAFALMVMTLVPGSLAWAAREEHTFDVSLTVPSRSFYLIPSDPGWIHRTQQLQWDPFKPGLSSLRKSFEVRHDSGAIEARLEGIPHLTNGRPLGIIELWVRFNNVTLIPQTAAREVVSAAEAAAGSRVWLEITPMKPTSGWEPGNYSGTVQLVFNAKAPGS